MTRPNVPDRGTNTRSEGDMDAATTAIETLGAGLVLVLPRVTASGMILLRIPRAAADAVAEVVASAKKQAESLPAEETIFTLTPHARLLVRGLLWMVGTIEVLIRV